MKYSCLLASCEILSTRKCFGYTFKNVCGRMRNLRIYVSMGSVGHRVLMPGCKFHFNCRVSPCLPPLCCPVWTVIGRHSNTGLPVDGSQIQSCFPIRAELSKMKYVVCSLHQCITWLNPQRCPAFKKMSDTSTCGTMQRCRRPHL